MEKRENRGRKPKLWSDVRRNGLIESIAAGLTHVGACIANGVSESEYRKELKRSAAFRRAIMEAEGRSEAVLVEYARKGAEKDGKVALAMLKARFPHRWGDVQPQAAAPATTAQATQLLSLLTQGRRAADQASTAAGAKAIDVTVVPAAESVPIAADVVAERTEAHDAQDDA